MYVRNAAPYEERTAAVIAVGGQYAGTVVGQSRGPVLCEYFQLLPEMVMVCHRHPHATSTLMTIPPRRHAAMVRIVRRRGMVGVYVGSGRRV